jgi:DNA-binding NtrC family response regulator
VPGDRGGSGQLRLLPQEVNVIQVKIIREPARIGVDDLPPEVGSTPPASPAAGEVRTLAEVERDYIAAALNASGGNRAKAAERLGIGAATLYRKLKQERR